MVSLTCLIVLVVGTLAVQKRSARDDGAEFREGAADLVNTQSTAAAVYYPYPPDWKHYRPVEAFEALGWDQLDEKSWFDLDCNEMIKVAGGWRETQMFKGGVCFTYKTVGGGTYGSGVFVEPQPRKMCETKVYYSIGNQNNNKTAGAPPEKWTEEDCVTMNAANCKQASYFKWCPSPATKISPEICNKLPSVEWTSSTKGFCWMNDHGTDGWYFHAGSETEKTCVDRWFATPKKAGAGLAATLGYNQYYQSRHVWCPAPQCMSNAWARYPYETWSPGDDKERPKGAKCKCDYDTGKCTPQKPEDFPTWMCGRTRVIDGTQGLSEDGMFKTWGSVDYVGAALGTLQWCPKDRQVPYTPIAKEHMRHFPLDHHEYWRVYNLTYYNLRCWPERDDCSPDHGPQNQLDWTSVNFDDIDCETFLVGQRATKDYWASKGGTCITRKSSKGTHLGWNQGFVEVFGSSRFDCDYGRYSSRGGTVDDKSKVFTVEIEWRTKYCPVCHWANDGTVCDKAPNLIVSGTSGWCWSHAKKATQKKEDGEDWRFRPIAFQYCETEDGMLAGWVYCESPTCNNFAGGTGAVFENFKCTEEYKAKGICDVVAPTLNRVGQYVHKSGMVESSGRYGTKVYKCDDGVYIPQRRPLRCPSNRWGYWNNGNWTLPEPECGSFKSEGECPARCSWGTDGCVDPPCSQYGIEKCPSPRCQSDGKSCKPPPCGTFPKDLCPAHCVAEDKGCVKRPCSDYTSNDCPKECSLSSDGTCQDKCDTFSGDKCPARCTLTPSGTCRDKPCSKFKDERTCPVTCTWDEDGCHNQGCAKFDVANCPGRCKVASDQCVDKPCNEHENQSTCPEDHCLWNSDFGCTNVGCDVHETPDKCPPGSCLWKDHEYECQNRPCADFDKDSCPLERCVYNSDRGCSKPDCSNWQRLETCRPNQCAWENEACHTTTTTTPVMFEVCPEEGAENSNECPKGCSPVDNCDQCILAASVWKKKFLSDGWPPRTGARPRGCFRNRKWKIKCNHFEPGSKYDNGKPKVGPRKGKYLICQKDSKADECR